MKKLLINILLTVSIICSVSCKKNSASPVLNGTVTDIDGGVYLTITIGTQIWMRENLNTTRYRNGDSITQANDKAAWVNLPVTSTGGWCNYNSDNNNGFIYGKLYNWYAVSDSRGLAPQGWHIPSHSEWNTLSAFLGGDQQAGGKMKSVSSLWMTPNTNASNSSGFDGLPGGYRFGDATLFGFMGSNGWWWNADESDLFHAWSSALSNDSGFLISGGSEKDKGLSVRCIKD